jgi:hypothetical protein
MTESLDHFIGEAIARADDLIAAIDGTTDQFDAEVAVLSEAVSALQSALLARKPFSVLLRYPGYARDDCLDTYYALVTAPEPKRAVAEARRQASAANMGPFGCCVDSPDDFALLLVTAGHHPAEALD